MINGKNIKIFVDAHVVDGPYQGSRTFIEELYSEMVNMPGIELYMAARDLQQLKLTFHNDNRIRFLQYKSRNRVERILLEIPSMVRRHQIDYAHFQYITPINAPCKIIVTTHDVIFKEIPAEYSLLYKKLRAFLYKWSAKKADIITTVSEHSRQSISRHFKISKASIYIVPNGINKNFFEPVERNSARDYIYDHYGIEKLLLCVSRIEPRKNHAMMVRAFKNLGLAARGYFLVFLGKKTVAVPALEKELKQLSGREKEQVIIEDNVSPEELKYFIAAASLFLYPSKGEGFGIPPLEAAAMQTPVICSNVTAMHDFSFFGDDHIDPSDEKLFEARIEEILKNKTGQNILFKRSAHIRENYSWPTAAEKFYQVIKTHHLNHQPA